MRFFPVVYLSFQLSKNSMTRWESSIYIITIRKTKISVATKKQEENGRTLVRIFLIEGKKEQSLVNILFSVEKVFGKYK